MKIFKRIDKKKTIEYSVNEFLAENNRKYASSNFYTEDYPENVLEAIAYGIINDEAFYAHYSDKFPEDMCEDRTDWDTMYGYAEDMSCFIRRVIGFATKEAEKKMEEDDD